MVHQIAADLVRPVGHTIGSFLGLRSQQQPRSLDGMCSEDKNPRGSAARRSVASPKVNRADGALRAHFDEGGGGFGVNGDPLEFRLFELNRGVVFGLYRANRNATSASATRRPVVILGRVPRLWRRPDLVVGRRESFCKPAIQPSLRDLWHWI